jgi:RNA polymerase sigma factor (TIGR02999 family)
MSAEHGDRATPITQLLAAAGQGDAAARERLFGVVYDELRTIARSQLNGSAAPGDMQPTTLVHEVYLRLFGNHHAAWVNRRHFYAAAARAMRSIRVDDVRKKKRQKRGGDRRACPLEAAELTAVRQAWGAVAADDGDETLLAVDEALKRLEKTDPRKAEIVELRFFAGLTVVEISETLGLSPRTIDSEWRFARAWLHKELGE